MPGMPDDRTHVALPPDIDAAIAAANAGDSAAWGRLYGIAGALLGGGAVLPSPLREAIAERLTDISAVLTALPSGGMRGKLPGAVIPGVKAGRPKGSLTLAAAQAVDDLVDVGARKGRRKQLLGAVVEIVNSKAGSPVAVATVDRVLKPITKRRRESR